MRSCRYLSRLSSIAKRRNLQHKLSVPRKVEKRQCEPMDELPVHVRVRVCLLCSINFDLFLHHLDPSSSGSLSMMTPPGLRMSTTLFKTVLTLGSWSMNVIQAHTHKIIYLNDKHLGKPFNSLFECFFMCQLDFRDIQVRTSSKSMSSSCAFISFWCAFLDMPTTHLYSLWIHIP